MRSFFRGLALAIPFVALHLACSDDDGGGGAKPSPEAGAGDKDSGVDPNDPDATIGPNDTGAPPITTDSVESLDVNGTTRKYVLSVPVKYDASKKYPLVLSFHGDGGSGIGQRKAFPFEVSSQQNAIIAYPTAIDSGDAWDLYDPDGSNPDFDLVKKLVPAIAAKYNVDQTKVLGFGYSKGAFFINQVACKLPGIFKAISSHAGGAPADDPNGNSRTCNGGGIPAFVFHGDADTSVDVGSGSYDAKFWAGKNGCDQDHLEATDPSPCQRHKSCPSDKPVTYCQIPGLGHYVWDRGVEVTWTYFTALP